MAYSNTAFGEGASPDYAKDRNPDRVFQLYVERWLNEQQYDGRWLAIISMYWWS